ncbi:ABC transporter permease [Saccharicrinis sp. FJH2]|uniref:ABC transporter permease n=1 Tax=Saccharicrinis sp. FJH65 TaxID=3344659 RepID=UPI0035F486B5
MALHNIRTAYRSLMKNKLISLINIIGFGFGISVCLALTIYVLNEFSYDRFHQNYNNIYRLVDDKNSSRIDYRVKDILSSNFAEVEDACISQRLDMQLPVRVNDQGFYLNDIMSVDNNFFKTFSFVFKEGDPKHAFTNINSAVITESTAERIFGNEDPMGKEIIINAKNEPVTISGILYDFPENSSIYADLLVNAQNSKFKFAFGARSLEDQSSYRWPFTIYVQLSRNTDVAAFAQKLQNNDIYKRYVESLTLLPLKDIYLRDHTTGKGSATKKGNLALIKLLSGIALIILVLSLINYMNLTVSRYSMQFRQISVRKILGATLKNLKFQFVAESLLLTSIALAIGVFILFLMSPLYYMLFNGDFSLRILWSFPTGLIIISAFFILGLLSGIGCFMMVKYLKNTPSVNSNMLPLKGDSHVKQALAIFQFAASIVLIICISVITRQIDYVKHKDPGFKSDQLLNITLPNINSQDYSKALVFFDRLKSSPYINSITASEGTPWDVGSHASPNIADKPDKNMAVSYIRADTSFLKTFDLKIIKGRDLMPGDYGNVCMINKSAYEYFEWNDLDNKKFNNWRPEGFKIIAVVNDFNFSSLHEAIAPLCIVFTNTRPTNLSVQLGGGSINPAMEYIKSEWKSLLPQYPLTYEFYDDWFQKQYIQEEQLAKSIGIFAIMAIVISCSGILGLVIFSSQRRIKEIGIRKVNGAKISEVMIMLNKDFIKWVAIAFILATPIAWYTMNKWLDNFAYKTNLSWWIFALAGMLALGIALLTVSFQSWKAATKNPVEALRYE